jgi:hypothetical protein
MNTEKISALLLTIEKGSISAAAEQINYTPSAVSRCIQSLEKDCAPTIHNSGCRKRIGDFRWELQEARPESQAKAAQKIGKRSAVREGWAYNKRKGAVNMRGSERRDYSRFEKLSTEELRNILRQDSLLDEGWCCQYRFTTFPQRICVG